jgi:biotin-(acetyl-CoA carboxylase) ligase
MEKVVVQLEQEYLKLRKGNVTEIDERYIENLLYYKQSRPYKMGQSIIQGTIENVDNEGKLCLRLTNGSIQKFAFKEIGFIY